MFVSRPSLKVCSHPTRAFTPTQHFHLTASPTRRTIDPNVGRYKAFFSDRELERSLEKVRAELTDEVVAPRQKDQINQGCRCHCIAICLPQHNLQNTNLRVHVGQILSALSEIVDTGPVEGAVHSPQIALCRRKQHSSGFPHRQLLNTLDCQRHKHSLLMCQKPPVSR